MDSKRVDCLKRPNVLLVFLLLLTPLAVQLSGATSYNITNLNVTVYLNSNTTAQVTEIYTLFIPNSSIQQYQNNRLALNLTLSSWQTLVGSGLVQHLLSPNGGVTNFKFLPGPVVHNTFNNDGTAYLVLSYGVPNATLATHISPRLCF